MTSDVRRTLASISIHAEKRKKHWILRYGNKIVICPSSASDHRSGMNLALEICRTLSEVQEKETKTIYLVDAGDYDLETPYQIIPNFNEWMEKGCEIEDIDGEDIRGVDYGDLYLTKMPKEGAKGLVTIKRAFNLEMSTGELLQKSKNLPTKLLSNITSSKADIIAEKIGMSGLFEIR